jgi:peptidoglycan/LPS O-acetylase OafA/YrhL
MARRLEYIDGLRGLAALSVVVAHWAEMMLAREMPAGLSEILRACILEYFSPGRFGVVAFFCISGFVIPFSFKGSKPLSRFGISRIFRLFPAYWLACGLTLLMLPSAVGSTTLTGLVANLTMVPKALGQPYILGVTWTLALELVFYAICAAAFKARVLHSAWFNIAAMAVFVAAALAMGAWRWGHLGSALPAGTATFLAAMHYGTLIRLGVLEGDPVAQRWAGWAGCLLLIAVTVANYLGYRYTNGSQLSVVAICTGYAAGIWAFLWCVKRRAFAGNFAVFLGGISYSLYLVHPIVAGVAAPFWPSVGSWWLWGAVVTAAFLVASLVLSMAIYRFIELPAQELGRRASRGLDQAMRLPTIFSTTAAGSAIQ